MKAVYIISFILFVTFYATLISKSVMFYISNRVRTTVAEIEKKKNGFRKNDVSLAATAILFSLIWVLQVFAAEKVSKNVGFFFESDIISYAGLFLTIMGMLIVNISMILMKTVCRVGSDKSVHNFLMTDGIYQYSRNPVFVGYNIMILGVFLTFPNVLTLCAMLLLAYFIHKQILQEEKHFTQIYGEAYQVYMDRTPRYIG